MRRAEVRDNFLRGRPPAARRSLSVGRRRGLAPPRRQGCRAEPRAAAGAHPERRGLQRGARPGQHLPHGRDPGGDVRRVRDRDPSHARGGPGVIPSKPVPEIYRRLGVRPIIHASGTTTRYGGSILRTEALEAMREAPTTLVNMAEPNAAAGAAIARMRGAEAAFVTAGASSGLILQAAACIAGSDPAKITRLPDTRGLRNEIIIQRAHRFAYDQAYRVAGGVLVEIGLARRTQPFELEEAITERTAAVAYLVSPFTSPPGILSLEQVLAIAHTRAVPVIVDAASMLPPRENLTKFLRLGADLVSFSGGKGIRGPQSTGILAGRRDLVRAAALNASPNQALGRAAKTSKEEIAGLGTALECFMAEGQQAEMKRYHDVCASIAEALAG